MLRKLRSQVFPLVEVDVPFHGHVSDMVIGVPVTVAYIVSEHNEPVVGWIGCIPLSTGRHAGLFEGLVHVIVQ